MKQWKSKELGHTLWLATFWGYRGVLELWDGTKKNDKQSLTHSLHKTR